MKLLTQATGDANHCVTWRNPLRHEGGGVANKFIANYLTGFAGALLVALAEGVTVLEEIVKGMTGAEVVGFASVAAGAGVGADCSKSCCLSSSAFECRAWLLTTDKANTSTKNAPQV